MKTCFFFVAFLFVLLPAHLAAQEQGPYERYLQERPGNQQFEEEDWEEAKKGLDFSEAALEKEQDTEEAEATSNGSEGQGTTPPAARNSSNVSPELASGILKFLAILILSIVFALILRGVLGLEITPRNKKVKHGAEGGTINLEKIERNIHRSDLDAYIRKALEQEEYALAVRLYYLSILKELSLRKTIRWERDKTNHQYVLEMRPSPLSGAFEEATRIFEQAWYGGRLLDRKDYEALEPKFRKLAARVKGG